MAWTNCFGQLSQVYILGPSEFASLSSICCSNSRCTLGVGLPPPGDVQELFDVSTCSMCTASKNDVCLMMAGVASALAVPTADDSSCLHTKGRSCRPRDAASTGWVPLFGAMFGAVIVTAGTSSTYSSGRWSSIVVHSISVWSAYTCGT
uniref:Uncharacterized protein n=1 Tax=Anopheles merus TaxID=30066 RepID=A0A182VD54_ANOME